jgi:ABC-2 type transport system permease protein
MKPILLIARRELAGYLKTWNGYVIIALMLFFDGLWFNAFAIGTGDKRSAEVLSNFFYGSSGVTMAAAVLLSMRLIAEERQNGTIQLLYSSPVRDVDIVVGKFLSALAFLGIFQLTTIYMPLMIMIHGKISWGQVMAGYFGLMLLGSAALAISIFASSLTRSQVVAAIVGAVLVVGFIIIWLLGRVTERPFSDIFTNLAIHGVHFQPFQSGLVHLRDIVYYLAMTYVFLFASTRVLEARRWR